MLRVVDITPFTASSTPTFYSEPLTPTHIVLTTVRTGSDTDPGPNPTLLGQDSDADSNTNIGFQIQNKKYFGTRIRRITSYRTINCL